MCLLYVRPFWIEMAARMANATTNPVITAVHRGAALAVFHTVALSGNLTTIALGSAQYASGFYLEIPYRVPRMGVELAYQTSAGAVKAHVFVLFDLYHVGSLGTNYRF